MMHADDSKTAGDYDELLDTQNLLLCPPRVRSPPC
jgi:hypothetical protein